MANTSTNPDFFYGPEVAEQLLGVKQSNHVANIGKGSQLGIGYNAPMFDVATPAVFVPTTLVVMSTPAMYGPTHPMTHLIKELIESHPKSVTGIDFGYSLANATTPAGHDGQEFAVPTKSSRSAVNPTFVFQEISGNVIWNFARKWIWDISNPDTMVSQAQMSNPGTYTMSTYSMSMMAIQFDPTMRPDHIIDAAYYTNMWPTNTGDLGFERNIGTTKPMERSISFQAYVQQNAYIKSLAKVIAQNLKLHEANYNVAPPNKREVDGALSNVGLSGAMASSEAQGGIQGTWNENSANW